MSFVPSAESIAARDRGLKFQALLLETLTKAGRKIETGPGVVYGPRVDGIAIQLQIRETIDHTHHRESGRLRLTFGVYGNGNKKQFPEPKGGFDVVKIAAAIEELVTESLAKKAQNERVAQSRDVNRPLAEALNAEFNGSEWRGLYAGTGVSGHLTMKLSRTVTEEQARALFTAYNAIFGTGK